jgi:hypothetical protein
MKTVGAFLTLALLAWGCAVQVKTYTNQQADFSVYQSWCWMQGCEVTYQGPKQHHDPRVIDEMANAIAVQLFNKGYVQQDDQSDLVVNFFISVEEQAQEIQQDTYMVGPPLGAIADNRDWFTLNHPEYQRFLKGTLVIDILDRQNSQLIWRGTAVRFLELNPEFNKDRIWKTVEKTMKGFPAKQ